MPVSRDMKGAMSATVELDVGTSGSWPAISAEPIASSVLGSAAEKLNTGRGGGGGGAKRDASAAAWSANIGAGGGTSAAKG